MYIDEKDVYALVGERGMSMVHCAQIDALPRVDVVPKSEVEKIFEEIEREINAALQSNYKVLPHIELSEELWDRVQGKIDAMRGIDGFVEELKKKYTEGEE